MSEFEFEFENNFGTKYQWLTLRVLKNGKLNLLLKTDKPNCVCMHDLVLDRENTKEVLRFLNENCDDEGVG
jgi:hypothetical protein